MKETDVVFAREFSRENRALLAQTSVCGCFYCLRIFDPKEIIWEPDGDNTAMCPYCGIDALIGETSNLPITKGFLRKMRDHWFSECD